MAVDQIGGPDPPARLVSGVADQIEAARDDMVGHAPDDCRDLLLLGIAGNKVVIDVPREVMAIELVAAGVSLAPEIGLNSRTEPDLCGLARGMNGRVEIDTLHSGA